MKTPRKTRQIAYVNNIITPYSLIILTFQCPVYATTRSELFLVDCCRTATHTSQNPKDKSTQKNLYKDSPPIQ